MCLILFALDAHPRYRFVLLANRDEFYERPTQAAHWWPPSGNVLAGKDLQAQGTWLAVSREGRLGAITNFRDGLKENGQRKSRGALPLESLLSQEDARRFGERLMAERENYNGFNLLFGQYPDYFCVNHPKGIFSKIEKGIHGLSNATLDEDWPKVRRGRAFVANWLKADEPDWSEALRFMRQDGMAPDAELPDTRIGLDMERKLSPIFVKMNGYGTRTTSLYLETRGGESTFREHTHASGADLGFRFERGQP